jgi:hypothetical protein
MRGTEKITTAHLERTGLVYIRQSSLAQVRNNTESTARQYALADEAVRLGWSRSKVEVIDADLGLSGRWADGRSGFKDLVSRVCLGEVGAIFGLEVSRLARSSADLSRLLEPSRDAACRGGGLVLGKRLFGFTLSMRPIRNHQLACNAGTNRWRF